MNTKSMILAAMVAILPAIVSAQSRGSLLVNGAENGIIREIFDKHSKHESLSKEESKKLKEFIRDDAIYQKMDKQTWPGCAVGFASDAGPDCNTLSKQDLKKLPYFGKEPNSGAELRFSYSLDQREKAKESMKLLEEKWGNQ